VTPRLDPFHTSPALLQPLLDLEAAIAASGLDHALIHLVKIRASQINGCAYCLHMHTADTRRAGETEARIYLLDAWHESGLYTERERAALGWTEALTRIADTHAPDEDYERLAAVFDEEERVALTALIGAINTWNRISIGFRSLHPA
jgi:AhpD family alkylhydroperoxidase